MNTTQTATLPTAAQLLKLRDVTVLRHGKAEKKQPNAPDSARKLTEVGRHHAHLLGVSLSDTDYAVAFSSPLERVLDTVRATGLDVEILPLSVLAPSEDPADGLNVLFERLGYAPLTAYMAETHPNGAEYIRQLGQRMLAEVWTKFESDVYLGATATLVGTHAVMGQALLLAIAEVLDGQPGVEAVRTLALETDLGEAHAFILTITNGNVLCRLVTPVEG